jgi:16S rRNA G966 N2-methylase RsmD
MFVDPPYRLLAALLEPLSLHLPVLLAAGGVAVIESSASADPPELPLALARSRAYGEVRLSLYEHA